MFSSASSSSSSSQPIDNLVKRLSEGQEAIESAKDNSVVLVIGPTGAGKSTLIHHLMEHFLQKKGTRVSPTFEVEENCSGPAIGESRTESKTVFPQCYPLDGYDFVLQDTAGFFDSRDGDTKLLVAVAQEMALRQAEKVKGVIIVIEAASLKATRASSIKDIVDTLNKIFINIGEILPSIQFVITKGEQFTKEDFLAEIEMLINDIKKQLVQYQAQLTQQAKEQEVDIRTLPQDAHMLELSVQLTFLQYMLKNQENNFHVTQYEKHVSELRRTVLSSLQSCPDIPKESIKYDNYSVENATLNNKINNELVKVIQQLNELKSKTIQLEDVNNEIVKLQNRIKTHQEKMGKPFAQQKALAEAIDEINKRIDKNIKKSESIDSEISRLRAVIEQCNSVKEVEFCRQRADETLEWYQIFSCAKHHFEYQGPAFSRVEVVKGNGEITTIENNGDDGRYDAQYVSDWYTNADATLKYHRRENQIPANIVLSQQYQTEIERLTEIKKTIEKSNSTMKKEKKLLEQTKSFDDVVIEQKISQLNEQVTQLKQQLPPLRIEIKNSRSKLKSTQPMMGWYKRLIDLYQFSSPIITEFNNLYQQYQDKQFQNEAQTASHSAKRKTRSGSGFFQQTETQTEPPVSSDEPVIKENPVAYYEVLPDDELLSEQKTIQQQHDLIEKQIAGLQRQLEQLRQEHNKIDEVFEHRQRYADASSCSSSTHNH